MEMALASSSAKQVWINDYLREYVRESSFAPYFGKAPTSIFRVKSELQNEAGKTINIPLITRLKGSGVTGSQILEGNEEDLGNYNSQVTVDWLRNAVVIPKSTSYQTEIDLFNAARDMLKQWSAEQLRDALIAALGAIVIPGADLGTQDTVVAYASASAAQRNAFGVNNKDRVLFGATTTNWSATWATAVATVGTAAGKLTGAQGSLAKRIAKLAGNFNNTNSLSYSPHIRPFKNPKTGQEYYVMFCNPYAFRDLKADTTVTNANLYARAREDDQMNNNPIFQDGDLLYDGVIYREVPELTQLTIVGGGLAGVDVAQNFLCGQSAVAVAYGQQPTPRQNNIRDYGFRPGVAMEELRGQRKITLGGVQFGMVTVLSSGVAD